MTLSKLRIVFIISIIVFIAGVTKIQGQPEYSKPFIADTLVMITPIEPIEPNESHTEITLRLVKIQQYMQSIQMIFELENNSDQILNNCWFHVSLLDTNRLFLYREQPLLFNSIGGCSKQMLELLCESVGIEEVGYIILHPHLLEFDREETPLTADKVTLIQSVETNAIMLFNSYLK